MKEKSIIQRIISFSLIFTMLLTVIPVVSFSTMVTAITATADSDFEIVDGVLIKYTGKDGNITIPSSVTSIGDGAFYWGNAVDWCSSEILTSVTIPSSVTSIGDWTFAACYRLTNIEVDKNNSYYTSENGILFDKNKTKIICYPASKNDIQYIIPSSVTNIGCSAFSGCDSLTSVTIPSSMASIGESAFIYCNSLKSVTIPSSVTSIGEYAFAECDNLIIYGEAGSYAETYAKEWDIKFVAITMITQTFNGHTYAVYNVGMTWQEAKTYCESIGGHLVTITSQQEQNFLTQNIAGSIKKNMWIGGERKADGTFGWVTGEAMNYTNWNVDEPNNTNLDENAIMMFTYSERSVIRIGAWFDESKNGRQWEGYRVEDTGFICEWDNKIYPSEWAEEEYVNALDNDLIPDELREKFQEDITRAEFCYLVVKLIEVKSQRDINTVLELVKGDRLLSYPFKDTNDNNVAIAYALGIIKGKSESQFAPNDSITREEAATMLTRLAKFMTLNEPNGTANIFSDTKQISDWAKESVTFVNACLDTRGNRIMNGIGNNTFSPKENYTREQAFITFWRLYNCLKQERPIKLRALSVCGDDGSYNGKRNLLNNIPIMSNLFEKNKAYDGVVVVNNINKNELSMPDAKTLRSAITTQYAGANWQDISYFYFGGHGYNGYNDGTKAPPEERGVTLKDSEGYSYKELLYDLLKVNGTIIIILDTCFSGSIKSVIDTYCSGNLKTINISGIEYEFNANKFKILMATDQDEKSKNTGNDGWKNVVRFFKGETRNFESIYTVTIGDGCGSFDEKYTADINKDRKITLAELQEYLSKELEKGYIIYRMTPQVFPNSNDETVIFKY